MNNPFDSALSELREMNKSLTARLDEIIKRLDKLIALEE